MRRSFFAGYAVALVAFGAIVSVAADTATATKPEKNRVVFRRYFDAARASGTLLIASRNGQIAFGRWLDAAQTTRALFAIAPNGTSERQLTHPSPGTVDDQPDWSRDGSKLAFERCTSRCEVWTIGANGSALTRLGPNCGRTAPPKCEDRSAPAWSPNGKAIAINRAWGPVAHDTIKFSALSVIDADGQPLRQLTVSKPFAGDVGNAMWSPDGKRLVFEMHMSAAGKPAHGQALFTMNADGSGQRRLTPWKLNGGDHPDWSPNGKRILFRVVPADEIHGGNIYTIRPDGTGLKQLTRYGPGTIILSYSFSLDGKWITFAKSGLRGEPDIFVMRANGTGVRPVTRTPLWESAPDWGRS
jgi:TolB protein